MKMDQLISDEEFLAQRSVLTGRLSDVKSQGTCDAMSPEQAEATLDIITKPALDLGGLWQASSAQTRRRFQRWAFPAGYVYGGIGTAQRGRLFSLFSTSTGSDTSLVHPTGDSWNHPRLLTETTSIEQPELYDAQNVPTKSNLHEVDIDLENDYWTMARVLIDFYRQAEGIEEEKLLEGPT